MTRFYKTFNWWILTVTFIALPFSFLAYGSDLSTQKSTLYPFNSSVYINDDFLTGSTGSGSIGGLGWISAGTISGLSSDTDHPGLFRLDTSAVSGTQSRISFHNSSGFDPSIPHKITWITRLNTNDANTLVRIGAANSVAGTPPSNGIYFEKLDADTNWFCVTRAGGIQTRTDSGLAVNTNFNTYTYNRNSSGVSFFINNTQVCSQSTNIPTIFTSMYLFIINSAAASKTLDVDYAEFIITGLTR